MQAGWFPDPAGDHEFRYHNGTSWTADVATDGVRGVSAVPGPRGSRSGTVAMVLGIISMSIGWIPLLCFVAVGCGVVAVASGLRRRHDDAARGAATVGIVTGAVGVVLSVAGIWLTVLLFQAVAAYEDPGPHEVELTDCAEEQGVTTARGTITNLDDEEHSYVVEMELDDGVSVKAEVSDVPAGSQQVFRADEDLRLDLDCSIVEVTGPLPFGIDP